MNLNHKVLIANRGEIAIRVIRTLRELGIPSVAVHSDADEDSLHVKLADESVCIGPARADQSYLNMAQVLSAAEITGATAIHPGYGFLSESSEFAELCEKHGILFIGPSVKSMSKMGDKIESKKISKEANVPTLEPIYINNKSENEIEKEVLELGFPILVKASAGGGGRGMRRLDNMDKLHAILKQMSNEALSAFGDGTLYIEKYIDDPRHIEVQILADHHGNCIHLGERDCTIQRRYQKLIEEAPSPVLKESVRKNIWEAAIKLAKAVDYNSVGTVEFLYDQDQEKFYFMEMNTRIQVEHPVTEQLTGVDLIKEQVLVALGETLTLKQKDITFKGHVIECRINAEDSEKMLPSPGEITHYHRPGGLGVRVDDFIYTGYHVLPYYDSMISKIIVNGSNRDEAIQRMKRALSETVVGGIKTNIDLHYRILSNQDFCSGTFNTHFLSEKML